jgi:hypothetical protein
VPYIDPFKVMRNSATLRAHREHQRALLGAGQPWFSIGIVAIALELGILFLEFSRGNFGDRNLLLIYLLLMFAGGLCFLVGGLRAWSYRRSHPLVLPETPSPFGTGGKAR